MKKILVSLLILTLFCSCRNVSNDEQQVARALKINKKVFTVNSHTDTPMRFVRDGFDLSEKHNVRDDVSKIDFPRMKEGEMDAVFFAGFLGQRQRDAEGNERAQERADQIFDSVYSNFERNVALARLAFSSDEACTIEKEDKWAVFLGVVNGYPIGNDLSLVEYFYTRGARYVTLCHTKNNDICDSSPDTTEYNGLSPFGVQVVKEMNRLGIMIDVSHISDSSFHDMIALSQKPVIVSHSSARAICDHPRNLTDDMLLKLIENGGVAQVCILSDHMKEMPPNLERDSARAVLREKYRGFCDPTDEEMKSAH